MNDSKLLTRLHQLEEEVEALRRAFQAVLFGEAVEAEHEGRPPLVERSGSLSYDLNAATQEQPHNDRLLRVLKRAESILGEATPTPPGDA